MQIGAATHSQNAGSSGPLGAVTAADLEIGGMSCCISDKKLIHMHMVLFMHLHSMHQHHRHHCVSLLCAGYCR